jgi:hypothetical protein
MSSMSPEEEEAVQAELEALEREAMVRLACLRIGIGVKTDFAACYTQRPRGYARQSARCASGRAGRVSTCRGGRR